MKERPIPFNGEGVRAILDGRKTQTRRPMKDIRVIPRTRVTGDFPFGTTFVNAGEPVAAELNPQGAVSAMATNGQWLGLKPSEFDFVNPFCEGQTELVNGIWQIFPDNGSRIWVQEEFGIHRDYDKHFRKGFVSYRADDFGAPVDVWREPKEMTQELSRIATPTKRVWVERLLDMTTEDFIAEGILSDVSTGCLRAMFFDLWDSIYGKTEHKGDNNPWVFACEFERIET